jgi:tape measure domain-containing protein
MPTYHRIQIEVDGKDNASGALSNVADSLNGLGKAALAVTGGALLGVAGGMAAAALKGISLNASMEQTRIAFAGLLKDGQAANAFLQELQAFSASTPFEFPELADASRKLLAFGFAAEDVIPMMTAIGDAVAGLGGGQAEIDRVTMALGQMQAKGKVSAEEMMQFAELGIPAWQMLADSMGLSVAEVMKLSEKGLIPASQAIPALLSGMEATFGGQMANQAMTFNGLLSTLQDNANLALMAFTGPLFEAAKGALGELGAAVSSPAFQQFAQTLGTQLGQVIAAIVPWLMQLASLVANLATQALPLLAQGWALLQAGIAALLPVMGPLVSLIGANLTPILVGLAAVLIGALVVAIGSFIASIVAAAAPILALVAVVALLYAAWQSNFAGIQEVTATVLSAVWAVIAAVLTQVQAFWQANGAAIMAFVAATWATIQQIIGLALAIIGAVVGGVLTFLAGFINRHGAAIVAYLTAAWNLIAAVVTTALNLIQGLLQTVLLAIRGDWQGAWAALQQTSATFVRDILRVIENGLKLVKQAFDLAISLIRDAWNAFKGDARGIGISIIDGIVGGVTSAASRLAQAAANAAKAALDAAKRALGIASPSKTFEAEVGHNIAAGMARGITGGAGLVSSAVTGVATKAVDRGRAAWAGTTTHNYYQLNYQGMHQDEQDVRSALRAQALLLGAA